MAAGTLNVAILQLQAIGTHFPKPSIKNQVFTRPSFKPISFPLTFPDSLSLSSKSAIAKLKLSALSSSLSERENEQQEEEEWFDWYSEWYPVAPVCDLDKRVPHGKMVLGIDLVIWWDKTENAWKVFDDCCPHRLAPLSQGRIDQSGRLQCVYHGWCFNGSGQCKLIPQAPPDGPPVHASKKACVASYPCTIQNDILWFWPNSDPKYQDILTKKQPPHIPEIDDPSYTKSWGIRDIPYGYEVLVENLMDPAHVPYAHYGIMRVPTDKNRPKVDKEGGRPLQINIETMDKSGFFAKQERGINKFIAPCVFYAFPNSVINGNNGSLPSVKEHKIKEIGPTNWQKSCYVPTKSDAQVVAFRKWLKKYSGGQVDWRLKFDGSLPPTPPREQLMDRYWTHVVNCSSCSAAYKGLNVAETVLQIMSIGLIGIAGVAKLTTFQRAALFSAAFICFAASKWLSHFVYKNFHFHDYNHGLR